MLLRHHQSINTSSISKPGLDCIQAGQETVDSWRFVCILQCTSVSCTGLVFSVVVVVSTDLVVVSCQQEAQATTTYWVALFSRLYSFALLSHDCVVPGDTSALQCLAPGREWVSGCVTLSKGCHTCVLEMQWFLFRKKPIQIVFLNGTTICSLRGFNLNINWADI